MQATIGGLDVAALTGAGAILSSLATLFVVAFNGGKITQKVADHEKKFNEQNNTNVYFNEKIAEHGNQLSRLEGIDLATRHHEN